MKEPVIKYTVEDQVATITLNRPDAHNALNLAITDSLLKILKQLNNDKSIRVVILQASGKNFCSGADLNWMKQSITEPQSDNESMALKLATLMNTLYHLNKPTIALVHGAVIGGGIGLICCCDIVLATADSHFCFSEVRLGLIPAVISPYIVKVIGTRAARRYCLSGEKFTVQKAFDLGVIHEILEQKQLQDYAKQLSATFMDAGPNALALAKKLINNVSYCKLDDSLIYKTAGWLIEAHSTTEAEEGITAFLENRPANWVNTAVIKSKVKDVERTSVRNSC